jgi:uncharacterized membrane protein
LSSRLERVATFLLLACLIACVGATIYLAASPKVGEKFTEFYILGPSGKAEGYPTNLTLGESGTVIIGVANHEYESVTYRIVVTLDNETISTIENITLNHDKKWERNYTFTPQKAGDRMKLQFLLYREGVKEPYRTLHLWVTVHRRG